MKTILILAVSLQTAAAIIALRQMKWSGEYRTAWGFIALALVLMVERRVHSFVSGQRQGPLHFEITGVLISLFMLVGIAGIQSLFRKLRKKEEELIRYNEKVEDLAFRDQLTLLPNRWGFLARADIEVRRAVRNGHPISLIMLDLDNLKTINDTWGHAAGDSALATIGTIIGDSLREFDVAGRYGGDEFIILLPDTPGEEAVLVGERLRRNVAEKDLCGIAISASIGVSTASHPDESMNLDRLIGAADEALYASKSGGRNCVTSSCPAGRS